MEILAHDFPSAGKGKLIPHGLYDLARLSSSSYAESPVAGGRNASGLLGLSAMVTDPAAFTLKPF